MKQTQKTDIEYIKKILRYIGMIDKTYDTLGVESREDFECNEICQLAIAQSITNIYEVKKKIRAETLSQVPAFDRILLKAARNIASHDYDSLDFEIIYKRTIQLLKPEVSQELEAIVNDFNPDNSSDK